MIIIFIDDVTNLNIFFYKTVDYKPRINTFKGIPQD